MNYEFMNPYESIKDLPKRITKSVTRRENFVRPVKNIVIRNKIVLTLWYFCLVISVLVCIYLLENNCYVISLILF